MTHIQPISRIQHGKINQGGPSLINPNQTNTPDMHNSTNSSTGVKLNCKKNEEWTL